MEATLTDKAAAVIETGDGTDSVVAKISDSATAAIKTGAGDDQVKLTDDAKDGKATIETGAGNDAVEVDARTAGNGGITVHTDAGDDTVSIKNRGNGKTPIGKIDVNLGEGDDKATLDVAVSDAATAVNIAGGEGNDAMHITGTLRPLTDKEKEEEKKNPTAWQDTRAYGSITDMNLVGENQNTLNIQSSGIETVSDELKNKRTVKLTPANGRVDYKASFGFTDYVINAPANKLTGVRVTSKNALPLTNLLINTPTTLNGENKLKINQGAIIDVRGMNLVLDAQNIEIDGILLAGSVQIRSQAGTGKYGRDFTAFYEEYKQNIDIPVLGGAGGAIGAAAVKAADLYNVDKDAKIVIGEGYDDDTEMLCRNVKSLSQMAGQEFQILYPVEKTKNTAKADYIMGNKQTLFRSLNIEAKSLPAGTYYLQYEVMDMFMRPIRLDPIEMYWDGNKLSFPEGFTWEGTASIQWTGRD